MRDRRPLLRRSRNIAGNFFQMLRRDDRADLGFRIERIADLDLGRKLSDPPRHLVGDIAMQDQARTGIAAFTGVEIGAEDGGIDEFVEIGVREHDLRVLAAEFQRHLLQRLCGIGHG
ncbi:hypothetical protein D9M70_591160 [compost metagenome]